MNASRTRRAVLVVLTAATIPLAGQTAPARPAATSPLPMSTPAAEGFSTQRLARLHAMIQSQIDQGKYAGAVSMIVRNGRIVDWRTFGHRDLEAKLPMERDTIVRLYSMTKVVTSVAALILYEEGRMKLEDPVSKYLPELAKMQVFTGTEEAPQLVEAKGPITVRHLLTHTSGFAYGLFPSPVDRLYEKADLWKAPTLADFITRVSKLPLISQPGERFYYGVNTDVLGAVVEAVAGQTFDRFVAERITKPLGMVDTAFDLPAARHARLAKIYGTGKDGRLRLDPSADFDVRPEAGTDFPQGGMGLFSTIGDYARFAQMLLNGGELDGVRVLGRKTVEFAMANHLGHLTPPVNQFSLADGFGLGGSVRIDLARGSTPGSVGQFGWSGAATTTFTIDPKEKMVQLLFMQHMPFDQHDVFWKFHTLAYAALN